MSLTSRPFHCMYFSDFVRLVRAHAAPYTKLDFLMTRFGPGDVVTVMDYNYPRRDGVTHTGYDGFDWYTASCVMNVPFNELPDESYAGDWRESFTNESAPYWRKRPITGYKRALARLLKEGCIVPSVKLDRLLGYDSRKDATNVTRLYYDRHAE